MGSGRSMRTLDSEPASRWLAGSCLQTVQPISLPGGWGHANAENLFVWSEATQKSVNKHSQEAGDSKALLHERTCAACFCFQTHGERREREERATDIPPPGSLPQFSPQNHTTHWKTHKACIVSSTGRLTVSHGDRLAEGERDVKVICEE